MECLEAAAVNIYILHFTMSSLSTCLSSTDGWNSINWSVHMGKSLENSLVMQMSVASRYWDYVELQKRDALELVPFHEAHFPLIAVEISRLKELIEKLQLWKATAASFDYCLSPSQDQRIDFKLLINGDGELAKSKPTVELIIAGSRCSSCVRYSTDITCIDIFLEGLVRMIAGRGSGDS